MPDTDLNEISPLTKLKSIAESEKQINYTINILSISPWRVKTRREQQKLLARHTEPGGNHAWLEWRLCWHHLTGPMND